MRKPLPRVQVAALFAVLPALMPAPVPAWADPPVIGHSIEARIDPASGRIEAIDRLTLPESRPAWELILHRGLEPRVEGERATLERLKATGHLERYRLRLAGSGPVAIAYAGTVRHGLASASEGMGRERQGTLGTIGPEGVYLDGGTGWYPSVPGTLERFELKASLPPGWVAISQGAGPGDAGLGSGVSTWSESQPQDEIYLVAGPYGLERAPAGAPGAPVEAQIWLRAPDRDLAAPYLAATRDYLDLYSRLIGPYPYAKFALVENFWESGYGMPSFTLLGPRVIRLPFILSSSYPHEILHNWWGNGVYVDYSSGNWSEGLTAYLADHLIKEREGQGADYRRDALKAYADYVRAAEDFPLTDFRGRHGSASQAIGYGKTAMVFHMLRRLLGDATFTAGLQRFYRDHRFRAASWTDVRRAFEDESGKDLGDFFAAWTGRTGAATLALEEVRIEPEGNGFRVKGRIAQTQKGAPLPLPIPVVAHGADGEPVATWVDLGARSADFEIGLPSRPVRVAVDPAFDTFRALLPGESPVALSNLFGAERGLILLPSRASPALLDGYRALAEAWVRGQPGWSVETDSKRKTLPDDRPVWVLGWENGFAPAFAEGADGFALDPAQRSLQIPGARHDPKEGSAVLTRTLAGQPVAWLAAAEPAALPGLARKVPHYGKYGWLIFRGNAPDNLGKGQWPAGDSALVRWLGDRRRDLKPWSEPPLAPRSAPASSG